MLAKVFFIFLFEFIRIESSSGQSGQSAQLVNNYLCTDEICERNLGACSALDEACRVQNATLNGIILPSQTPCSCCETCLQNLNEGDDCTIGLIGAPVPNTVCGPDLVCTKFSDDEHATCQYRTATTCLKHLGQFSDGIKTGDLGHLMVRPECDTLGDFTPIQCIPGQICYCVDRYGQRIFGESLYTTNMALRMRCECSRQETKARQALGVSGSNNFIRCDAAGSYESILCLGDKCICVDPHSGSPTSPVYNRTNLDDLQATWKCFDGNATILERPCEKKREDLSRNLPSYLTTHDLNKMCQPDGFYYRVQRNSSHYFCADKFGMPIKNYAKLVEENLSASPSSSPEINCNCARVVDLLAKNSRIEFPQCCPNGNYKRINCRRGYCYCVDANGHQISVEVPRQKRSNLPCFADEFTDESECN